MCYTVTNLMGKMIMGNAYVMRFWSTLRHYQGVSWSGADRPGFVFQHTASRAALGTLSTHSHLSKAYRGSSSSIPCRWRLWGTIQSHPMDTGNFTWVKSPEYEADNSVLSSTEVKNAWLLLLLYMTMDRTLRESNLNRPRPLHFINISVLYL